MVIIAQDQILELFFTYSFLKMARFLITAFCLLVVSGICQSSFQWAAKMGGTDTDSPAGIVTDIQGDVYTAGNFHGTSDFDPGSGTSPSIS